MTTQLAIGHLAAGRRNPPGRAARAPARSAPVTDSMSDRPAIPRAVIDWSDADLGDETLPVGAGDPAAAVDGPPSFLVLPAAKRVARVSADAVMFSVLVAMLLGLAGAVAKVGEQPNTAWAPRDAVALAAVGGKVPSVDVKITRVDAVAAPAVAAPGAAATLASTARPTSTN